MPYHIKNNIQFLAESSKILSSSLDYNVTLASIADLIVTNIADFCLVDIIEKGQMIRVAARASKKDKQKLANKFFDYPPDPQNKQAIYDAAEVKKPIVIKTVTDKWLRSVSRFKEEQNTVKDLELKSLIFAPMISRGKVVGVITMGSSQPGFSYSDDDAAFIDELASRAGLAVDNARLFSRAQEALRTRDEFLSIASHELKTPLTSILLNLQLALSKIRRTDGDTLPQNVIKMIEQSEQQGRRLSKLINDLLNISVISTGRLEIEREPLDLRELTDEVIGRFKLQLKKAKTRLILKGKKGVVGLWDKVRLEQVISNLISNAIKYGGAKPIRVEIKKYGKKGIVSVKDQGIGIKSQDLGRIFERFKRAVSGRDFKGLGVGLYISKQIVEAHGGKIKVKSKEGKGSEFTVELPLIS